MEDFCSREKQWGFVLKGSVLYLCLCRVGRLGVWTTFKVVPGWSEKTRPRLCRVERDSKTSGVRQGYTLSAFRKRRRHGNHVLVSRKQGPDSGETVSSDITVAPLRHRKNHVVWSSAYHGGQDGLYQSGTSTSGRHRRRRGNVNYHQTSFHQVTKRLQDKEQFGGGWSLWVYLVVDDNDNGFSLIERQQGRCK